MTTDQELRDRLAEAIAPEGPSWRSDRLDRADAILDDRPLLDDICEYRARQINAERGEPSMQSGMDDAALGAIARKLFGHPPPGIYGGLMLREAAASVALDHDEHAQTYAVGGSDDQNA